MNYAYSIPADTIPQLTAQSKNLKLYNEDYYKHLNPAVYEFFAQYVDITSPGTRIMDNFSILQSKNIHNGSLVNYICPWKVNDVPELNNLFRIINQKLSVSGIYIGCANSNNDMMLKNKKRNISLPEILGRLIFCGFEIINYKKIGSLLFYAVKKVSEPQNDNGSSRQYILKMKRIGKNEQQIYVYKLRTMYPYSEYLQQYIFERFGTINGDKPIADFRITRWGRILRRLWIDELPMILNFFKGEVKLVGVRPLSNHKFNIYPEYLQKRRIQFKPGLIPPFYADLPDTQEAFFMTEIKYLDQYEKDPVGTDFRYFFKACYNILIKHARSA